jgi:hypothetical protein
MCNLDVLLIDQIADKFFPGKIAIRGIVDYKVRQIYANFQANRIHRSTISHTTLSRYRQMSYKQNHAIQNFSSASKSNFKASNETSK